MGKERFWKGYKECGRDWAKIAREFVKSRTPDQVTNFALRHKLMKPRDESKTLIESIRIVLARAPDGMSPPQIAKAIQEDDNLYDFSGVNCPRKSVSGILVRYAHLFVRTSP